MENISAIKATQGALFLSLATQCLHGTNANRTHFVAFMLRIL